MQAYLLVGPSSIDGCGGVSAGIRGTQLVGPRILYQRWNRRTQQNQSGGVVVASAAINREQDHYTVLGISSTASSADIKRAYRLLARKFHPDVCKDSQAGEVFKSIRLAYDVLSNEETRAQYDYALKFQEDSGTPWKRNWTNEPKYEEEINLYRWAELRRKMWHENYWRQYEPSKENSSSFVETEDIYEEETSDDVRGPFSEVLRFAFLTLFLTQTLGSQVSLSLCSLTALFDKKLDAGYKLGYLIAWVLGGRGGILLTLCLLFASWLCGKTSSSHVALIVVAMWVSMNLSRYAPLPQGALITLLYMSIKLQVDLSY